MKNHELNLKSKEELILIIKQLHMDKVVLRKKLKEIKEGIEELKKDNEEVEKE